MDPQNEPNTLSPTTNNNLNDDNTVSPINSVGSSALTEAQQTNGFNPDGADTATTSTNPPLQPQPNTNLNGSKSHKRHGLAIASILIGVVSLFLMWFWPFVIFPIIGLVLGVMAIVKNKTKMAILGLILCGISIVGVLLFVLASSSINKDLTTFKTQSSLETAFFTALSNKDYSSIYKYQSENSIQKSMTQQQLESGFSKLNSACYKQLFILEGVNPTPTSTKNNSDGGVTATFDYTYSVRTSTDIHNDTCSLNVNMKQQPNGNWLLYKPSGA